jgi:hypothetical protein
LLTLQDQTKVAGAMPATLARHTLYLHLPFQLLPTTDTSTLPTLIHSCCFKSMPLPLFNQINHGRTTIYHIHKAKSKSQSPKSTQAVLINSKPKSTWKIHNQTSPWPSKPADYNNHSPPNLLSTIPFISTRVQN